mmetsp:Transcript_6400/g.9783  ORF Transcript_6400/g.9783 Transcript_6400/m.9783 type:complete len:141 (+) Transcript_6400:62-484(+)
MDDTVRLLFATRSITSACRTCLHGWSKHFTSRYDPSTPYPNHTPNNTPVALPKEQLAFFLGLVQSPPPSAASICDFLVLHARLRLILRAGDSFIISICSLALNYPSTSLIYLDDAGSSEVQAYNEAICLSFGGILSSLCM